MATRGSHTFKPFISTTTLPSSYFSGSELISCSSIHHILTSGKQIFILCKDFVSNSTASLHLLESDSCFCSKFACVFQYCAKSTAFLKMGGKNVIYFLVKMKSVNDRVPGWQIKRITFAAATKRLTEHKQLVM